MDFQDADLNVVIKFMGELTGKNFLVSDQVKGKVTIISPKKITVREAYKVFESVLEMNATRVQGTTRSRSSFRRGPPVGPGDPGGKRGESRSPEDRMITQIIPWSTPRPRKYATFLLPRSPRRG